MLEMRSRINARSVAGQLAASGKWVGKTLRTLREDNRGATAVLAAIMLPAVIGGFGLGAETGYWYYTQRKIQHAADVAAHAAGVRKRSGDDAATYEAVALKIATDGGYRYNMGAIEVNSPPSSGAYSTNPDAVEVILTENLPRLFTALFANTTVPIRSRAVVLVDGGTAACILALGPVEPQAIDINGNATVTLDGCDIASNSLTPTAYDQGGTTELTTGCIHTVGEANVGGDLTLTDCGEVKEYAPTTADPYAAVAEPSFAGNCSNFNATGGSGQNMASAKQGSPGHYCGMAFHGQSFYHLNSGVYIVDGDDFVINSGVTVFGTDVTIYLVNGARINISGSPTIDLAAPTSGVYSGILFFAERDASTQLNHTINGSATTNFTGAIYAPTDDINYAGGAGGVNGCLQVIGWTVEMTGNSEFESECDTAGTTDIAVGESVTIVE